MKLKIIKIAFIFVVLNQLYFSAAAQSLTGSEGQRYSVIGVDEKLIETLKVNFKNSKRQIERELLHALEQKGYLLATVSIDNTHKIIVDLGHVSNIVITGFREKTKNKIKDYLSELDGSKAVHMKSYEKAVTLINDLHGVSASFAFEKDQKNGGYELIVSGEDRWQYGSVSVDNTPRKMLKENRFVVEQNFSSMLTGGDDIRLQGVYVEGLDEPVHSIAGSYVAPVGRNGAYYEINVSDVRSKVEVHGQSSLVFTNTGFQILPGEIHNKNSEGTTASLGVGYPIMRDHTGGLYVLGGVTYNEYSVASVGKVENKLLDLSLFKKFESFSGYSLMGNITFTAGKVNSYLAEETGDFAISQIGGGYIQPLTSFSHNTEVKIEGYGQIGSQNSSNARLLSLGSIYTLRGYESSTYIGASGFIGSVEVAHAFMFSNSFMRRLTLLAFTDFGRVFNPSSKENTTNRDKNTGLQSLGFGANIYFANNIQLRSYLGAPIIKDYTGKLPGPSAYMNLAWGW